MPLDVLRDRVLFETTYVCGGRAAEVCGLDIEDFDLRQDDEHVRIHGKGGTVSSTLASPSKLSADAWATPPPRPPSSTPCSPTRSPTPRSAPPAAAATAADLPPNAPHFPSRNQDQSQR